MFTRYQALLAIKIGRSADIRRNLFLLHRNKIAEPGAGKQDNAVFSKTYGLK
jgi:hypothetical protein